MNYELPTTIYPNRLSSPHSQKVLEIPSITLFRSLSAVALAKADAFCAFLRLKNPFNQRNPRLLNYLRACKALYICRETFTDVMSPLQIRLFMQNKAKFRKSQMNVNKVLTKDYDIKTLGERGKKQSQTNPNKAKFKKAKMNVTSIITKGYENKPPIRAPKKQSQTSKRQKPMQTSLSKGIMKKTAISGSGKTNPNKANPPAPQTLPIWLGGGKLRTRFGEILCEKLLYSSVQYCSQ